MEGGRSEFARPASLALMAIAAVGWLVAIYFWAQAVDLRAEGEEALRRAEVARQELVGELQSLQHTVGAAAELRKKLDDGRKALDDAVAQRTGVQNDLSELTRKVDETELSLASETDEVEFEDGAVERHATNLKTTQDELADLAAQKAAIAAELDKARTALAEAQAQARAADASAVAAKTAETDSRAQGRRDRQGRRGGQGAARRAASQDRRGAQRASRSRTERVDPSRLPRPARRAPLRLCASGGGGRRLARGGGSARAGARTRAGLGAGLVRARGGAREARATRPAPPSAYREALRADPEDAQGAGPRLARLEGREVGALPPAYVARLFDDYAPRFDRHLRENLGYRGPELIVEALDAVAPGRRFRAGARSRLRLGTGGAGVAGAGRAARWGRSFRGMIAQARRAGSMTNWRSAISWRFLRGVRRAAADLIVAADALVYLGDLRPVVAAVAAALAEGGLFAFTVETGDAAFSLKASLRFQHSDEHLRVAASEARLTIAHLAPASTRREAGVEASGRIVVLSR